MQITGYESFKNSRECVYDRVYFSKVARLQCEDSNFTTSRLNQRFSLEYTPKISCLKKNNVRKKSAVNQSFRKFLTCDPVVHSRYSLNKNGAHVRYFMKIVGKISPEKTLMYLWEKLFGGNIAGVESIPAILIKTAEALEHGLCKIALINFGYFLL